MSRWRWLLVASACLLAFLPLLLAERPPEPCRPEMEIPPRLLAGHPATPQPQPLPIRGASWQITTATSPTTAQTARSLCAADMPCTLKIDAPGRFALITAEPEGGAFAGLMVVQDTPTHRLTLRAPREATPEGATCGALAAWMSLPRASAVKN